MNTIRYSDTSVIARIYTEEAGLRSFMVRVGKGKNALMRLAFLQPLTLVNISFRNDPNKGLLTPKNLERDQILSNIPFDTIKTCIALFLAEVIARSIGEEESNKRKFDFLRRSVLFLDGEKNGVSNFHLKFMLEFSRYLGFYPSNRTHKEPYFDLYQGEFVPFEPDHPYFLSSGLTNQFENLIEVPFEKHYVVEIDNGSRRILLQKLVDYYRLHLEGMKEITAHKVLEEVLS
ncbi:MAG: DNA repair protein RecO [Flavobacteriales bacterium]|nr:DNA repair protein RecO [Flavobacteriales bacterium]